MAYESVKIRDIVDRSVNHSWSIPEFQRGFVWKPTQVRDLAESLWLDFPIGSLLVWNSQQQTEERIVRDAQRPTLWVVDGQQRATALSILFGRKPYWWRLIGTRPQASTTSALTSTLRSRRTFGWQTPRSAKPAATVIFLCRSCWSLIRKKRETSKS